MVRAKSLAAGMKSHCSYRFGNQFRSLVAEYMHPEDAVGFCAGNDFDQPFGVTGAQRSPTAR